MEEIAGGLLRFLGGVLWDLLLNIILFNIGRFSLLLITLGHYPQGEAIEKDAEKITWAGVFVLFLIWLAIALYNNYR